MLHTHPKSKFVKKCVNIYDNFLKVSEYGLASRLMYHCRVMSSDQTKPYLVASSCKLDTLVLIIQRCLVPMPSVHLFYHGFCLSLIDVLYCRLSTLLYQESNKCSTSYRSSLKILTVSEHNIGEMVMLALQTVKKKQFFLFSANHFAETSMRL